MTQKEINTRFRQKRKEQGLCLTCGKPLDRKGVRCIECNQKKNEEQRKDRVFYKAHGICPRCRKNKLFGDEKECPECKANSYDTVIKNRDKEKYNLYHKEWSRTEYQRRKENGICTRCGKRKADYGYYTCGICRQKDRDKKRSKSNTIPRSERINYGLCYFCGEPVKSGYKVCEKHYQMNVEIARSQKAKEVRAKLKKQGILY